MARTAQRRTARLAYSISRLARESDISHSMIYEEIAAGRLIARKIGRCTIVRRADVGFRCNRPGWSNWRRSVRPTAEKRPRSAANRDDAAPEPALAKAGDASRFAWLPGDDRQYDLVVTLDDATGAIYLAFLVEEEGTLSSFRDIGEVVDKRALFCDSIPTGAVLNYTPKAREPVSRTARTQINPALAQFGIRYIAGY